MRCQLKWGTRQSMTDEITFTVSYVSGMSVRGLVRHVIDICQVIGAPTSHMLSIIWATNSSRERHRPVAAIYSLVLSQKNILVPILEQCRPTIVFHFSDHQCNIRFECVLKLNLNFGRWLRWEFWGRPRHVSLLKQSDFDEVFIITS